MTPPASTMISARLKCAQEHSSRVSIMVMGTTETGRSNRGADCDHALSRDVAWASALCDEVILRIHPRFDVTSPNPETGRNPVSDDVHARHAKIRTPTRNCSFACLVSGINTPRHAPVPCNFTRIFGYYQHANLQAMNGRFRSAVLIFAWLLHRARDTRVKPPIYIRHLSVFPCLSSGSERAAVLDLLSSG